MNHYVGHPDQYSGVEEFRRQGGTGDGMRSYRVRGGRGLECMISLDRAGDPAEVSYRGCNLGFLAPCGYAVPQRQRMTGPDFLRSFMTTCGLNAAGSPCEDDGEETGLHGTISNTPCEYASYRRADEGIRVFVITRDASLFGRRMLLEREYFFPARKSEMHITDRITNLADASAPFEILYHCNMGYPLLDEDAELRISSAAVAPRNARAAEGIDRWNVMEVPQAGFEEQCYYHTFSSAPQITLTQPKHNVRLRLEYDPGELPFFTEWKMMGQNQYVLGLEPGNCLPDGRAAQRQSGALAFLQPGESAVKHLHFLFETTEGTHHAG